MAMPESINVNGVSYPIANLSEEARNQVVNIQAVDGEIARLQTQLAIAQTARNAYFNALTGALPAAVVEPAAPGAVAAS